MFFEKRKGVGTSCTCLWILKHKQLSLYYRHILQPKMNAQSTTLFLREKSSTSFFSFGGEKYNIVLLLRKKQNKTKKSTTIFCDQISNSILKIHSYSSLHRMEKVNSLYLISHTISFSFVPMKGNGNCAANVKICFGYV